MRLSVIVPTVGRDECPYPCLRRLLPQLRPEVAEVIVVDDSNDGIELDPQLRSAFVRVVRTPGGVGPSSARNRGSEASEADWLIFLDDDDLPDSTYIETFMRLVDGSEASIASVGFRRSFDEKTVVGPSVFSAVYPSFNLNYLAGTFAVRRDLFSAAGRFDERMRSSEMTELMLRMIAKVDQANGKVVSSSSALLTIVDRPRALRPGSDPETHLAACRILLSKHAHVLARDPRVFRGQLRAATNAAARMSEWREARGYACRAWRRYPWNLKDFVRLALLCVRPLAKRHWAG